MFFPPNCTAWKQPCDLGIIAALKKRYRYLYLKDILNFHELDNNTKKALKTQGKAQRRGAAGVSFGNPAHLMDAAGYIKEAWDNVSPSTIRNAFISADLKMNLGVEVQTYDVNIQDVIVGFNVVNIDVTSADFEATLDIDTEGNPEYQAALVEEADEVLKEQEVLILENNKSEQDSPSLRLQDIPSTSSQSNITLSSASTPSSSISFKQSQRLGSIFQLSLEIDEKLTDPQTSIDSGPHYDSIKGAFENFQKALKKGMVFEQRQQSQKKETINHV